MKRSFSTDRITQLQTSIFNCEALIGIANGLNNVKPKKDSQETLIHRLTEKAKLYHLCINHKNLKQTMKNNNN